MKIFLVAGARPNFMKIAPLYREALKRNGLDCRIVHTGQHYDYEMSQAFFKDLELPKPSYFLDAGSGSHAIQTAKIMVEFEKICETDRPDIVMVVGDVNSTLACSIVAKKMLIEVAHIEAGLRSFDLTMPEEINRMVTDTLSDHFFVTEKSGKDNLIREGKSASQIHFVGNVMVDNLLYQIRRLSSYDRIEEFGTSALKANHPGYAFLTLHRPSNVDSGPTFSGIVSALNQIAMERAILFPVHPRTKAMIEKFRIRFSGNVHLLPPLSFKESLFLWKDAAVVLTDSGGLQEETTALGIPCVTIRNNTERPITVEQGTNMLAGTTAGGIVDAYRASLPGEKSRTPQIPEKWDGKASVRIWDTILNAAGP